MTETIEAPVVASTKERTVVLLGNDAPMMQAPEFAKNEVGEWHPTGATRSVAARHINQSETRIIMQPDYDDQEHVDRALSTDNDRFLSLIARQLSEEDRGYAIGISQIEQLWTTHSGSSKPAYVTSNDPKFAEALGRWFDGIPVGQYQALLTNNGRDLIHNASFTTGAQPAAANYMGLANNATATTPNATDTALTGEITTAGGGLIRKQGTFAHTAGTNTTTLTTTFTANGTDSLPVTVSQIGIFNAITAGTLTFKTALSSNATLTTSGDNVSTTETITGG